MVGVRRWKGKMVEAWVVLGDRRRRRKGNREDGFGVWRWRARKWWRQRRSRERGHRGMTVGGGWLLGTSPAGGSTGKEVGVEIF